MPWRLRDLCHRNSLTERWRLERCDVPGLGPWPGPIHKSFTSQSWKKTTINANRYRYNTVWYRSTIKSSRYWSYVHQLSYSFKGAAHIAGIDGFWTDSVQKTYIAASFSKVDDHPARMWRICIFCQHFNLTALRYIAGKANHRLIRWVLQIVE